jgi:hypothetical protein
MTVLLGCAPTSHEGPHGPRNGVGAGAGGDAGVIATMVTDDAGLPLATGGDGGLSDNCGIQNFMLQKGLPPDLLIVLDRSGSMADAPSGGGGSKWSQVGSAINTTVSQLQGQIAWGLETFPSDMDCGTSSMLDVPVGLMSAAAINSAISGKMPGGNTPTRAAIGTAAAYLNALSDGRPKYILLATDGEPNCAPAGATCMCPGGGTPNAMNQCCLATLCIPCIPAPAGGDDNQGAEDAIAAAATAGVSTFVVGIATDPGADTVLNKMAENGKGAQPGATKYYPVGSSAALVSTINVIASQIISCTLPLTTPPPHPEYVKITADGVEMAKDPSHTNGWDFGPNNTSIHLYGAACNQLQSMTPPQVKAVYGCPPVT